MRWCCCWPSCAQHIHGREGGGSLNAILALGLLQSFFYVETRHRVVIEPLLIFLAMTVLFEWRPRLFRSRPHHALFLCRPAPAPCR